MSARCDPGNELRFDFQGSILSGGTVVGLTLGPQREPLPRRGVGCTLQSGLGCCASLSVSTSSRGNILRPLIRKSVSNLPPDATELHTNHDPDRPRNENEPEANGCGMY